MPLFFVFAAGLPFAACRSQQASTMDAGADRGDPSPRVTSPKGSVGGPVLPGWQVIQAERAADGFELDELKWKRLGDSGVVLLYAKDYAVSADETVATLTARDWRSYYGPLLQTVRAVDRRPTTFASRPAVAVRAEGAAPDGSAVTVDEVYVPVHGHVLLTSASGSSREMAALASDIDSWRAAVDFTALH